MDFVSNTLEEQYLKLHDRGVALLRRVPPERLYWTPPVEGRGVTPIYSCGEHLLRGAAVVEQTFGGITVNLWDDPFEWTLPEALPTPAHVAEYLREAEATRRRGFALLGAAEDLRRDIIVPSGERQTLLALILQTLCLANRHQGRAEAIFRLFSANPLPHI